MKCLLMFFVALAILFLAACGDQYWDVEIDPENSMNFQLTDYNANGYLDMGLRASPGGPLMSDPHYFWAWDIDSDEFVKNEELELINGGGYWEQALLGADFVLSHMEGDTIKEYIRVVENDRVYELFTLFDNNDRKFSEFHETRLFISDIIDGEYLYLVSFEIPERRANASGGLILLDIDFDGINDVLVWLGHEGNQGIITYAAFLSRSYTYIETNFHEIPFPVIDNANERFKGSVRNWAASHYIILYEFINDEFTATDSFNRELCRDTGKLRYTILSIDGQRVNEVLWYEYDKAKIYSLFYCDEGRWGLGTDRWQSIFRLH